MAGVGLARSPPAAAGRGGAGRIVPRRRPGAGRDGQRTLLTVGGDCGIDVAPVESALAQHGDRLAVVWIDAHADLNTPASSPSGAFHGMVLRTLLGAGPPELAPARALRPEQVVLAGVRALDPEERRFLVEQSIRHVPPSGLTDPTALAGTLLAALDGSTAENGAPTRRTDIRER